MLSYTVRHSTEGNPGAAQETEAHMKSTYLKKELSFMKSSSSGGSSSDSGSSGGSDSGSSDSGSTGGDSGSSGGSDVDMEWTPDLL